MTAESKRVCLSLLLILWQGYKQNKTFLKIPIYAILKCFKCPSSTDSHSSIRHFVKKIYQSRFLEFKFTNPYNLDNDYNACMASGYVADHYY